MMQAASVTGGSGGATPVQSLSGSEEFMVLLIAQLKAQDPLSPMDPSEFMTQLAQLQSVAELQNIGRLLADSSLNDAVNLIGRTVRWADPATGEINDATVERVELSGGRPRLIAGDAELTVDDLIAIGI